MHHWASQNIPNLQKIPAETNYQLRLLDRTLAGIVAVFTDQNLFIEGNLVAMKCDWLSQLEFPY